MFKLVTFHLKKEYCHKNYLPPRPQVKIAHDQKILNAPGGGGGGGGKVRLNKLHAWEKQHDRINLCSALICNFATY